MNADILVREEASSELDHVALGWVAGIDLSLHQGPFLIGIALDLRTHYGIATPASMHFVPSAMLRLGWSIERSREEDYWRPV